MYHSHVQDVEVEKFLNEANLEFFFAEASQTYPIDIEFVEKDADIK